MSQAARLLADTLLLAMLFFPGRAQAPEADTVHVAPPTGETETDRASILGALDEVEPGGTVQFAAGTYLVGEILPVPRPGITLLAHEDGTTLRGCEPGDYPRDQALHESLASGEIEPEEYGAIVRACGLMELTGGGVAVRGFTIEYTRLGVCISSCFSDPSAPVGDTVGGYRIENNTFRHSGNGVRGQVVSSDTTVIRDNRFINTFHAVSFLEASHLQIVDNGISAPEPEGEPGFGHVSFAIALGGDRNLVARNWIEGHPDGILLAAAPGDTSSGNVIRENKIAVARNPLPDGGSTALASSDPADSTIVGVPLAIHGQPVPTAGAGRVSENLVEGNRILGAEGIGIELYRASGNRIVDNEVSGVVPRRPFPGNSVSTDPGPWQEANGSGVWLSRGSDENQILRNTFEDVAGGAVFLEGDDNRVGLRSAADFVRDLGTGNEVTATDAAAPPEGERETPRAAGDPDSLPRARPNGHRTTAGRMVDGELRVELEAVQAAWYPRGPDGPGIVTPAFAERGHAPQVPGPLIRTSAGTRVRVSVRNTLERTITVRGLVDRASVEPLQELPDGAEPGDPRFFFADSLVVPAGATREIRFTPTAEVSSFYYGRRAAPEGGSVNNGFFPGNFGDEGVFLGALVVDPAGVSEPPDERIMLISRWAGREEPSTLTTTFKMMINGLSWPFTERFRSTVGDTVRWRIINTSVIEHPMHLHGHYFHVDARGDTDADTVYARADRPLVVTDVMPDFSSLRLSWVPDRPGNWLFHCHLIRHMGSAQRFTGEEGEGARHDMGGLVMGITVDPGPGGATREPPPRRTIHLWTARTPGVFGDRPALSFVAREDASAPPEDTLVVPGSPLVLERDEATEIVVHNRLDLPISVHWHGLEVRSVYDGVAHWSGRPGATRPPVAPGDSATVRITPPRAGTFIYHVHGEAGHELSQGLYGPFLVLPRGEAWDRERDRVFVLAARGARRDPPPVVNGDESPPPERFAPGGDYRLRFIHISPDASKRVRLLKDGEPVRWRPRAKDGADLPASARALEPAEVDLGVGETFDAEWTPAEAGAHTLEVVTTHYSASGLPPTVQRVAFGVGEVAEEALAEAARVEPPEPPPPSPLDTMPSVELEEDRLRRLVGSWTAPGVPVDFVVEWRDGELRMYRSTGQEPHRLVPLSPTLFRWEDERSVRVEVEEEGEELVLVVFGMRLRRTPEGADARPAGRQPSDRRSDPAGDPAADTVHVAPPTGEMEADRASILAALAEVEPGGAVRFAPGTYLVGDYVRLTVPRVTLEGHSDGTTIRGCDPDHLAEGSLELVFACNGFELAAGHQTIRGLVFEHVWHGLYVGCCYPEDMEALSAGEGTREEQPGGHLIEGNSFRGAVNGLRVLGPSDEPSVIRENVFRNAFHAVQVNSGTAHVLDNDIEVTDPGEVPPRGRPGNAVGVFPEPPVWRCGENVVAGNRIEGYADAILLANSYPGTRCRGNVIRDNTIVVRRLPIRGERGRQGVRRGNPSDSTVVGVPVAVTDLYVPGEDPVRPVPGGLPPGIEGEAILGDHVIEGNHIIGAEGIGIEIRRSSGNRIVDNDVTGIEARRPFPGNVTHSADPEAWREANGSGIWISPHSNENEVVGNTFEDVAGAEVFLEGDGNRVELRSPGDMVRDLGAGNRVSTIAREPDLLAPGQEPTVLAWGECPFDRRAVEEAGGLRVRCGELPVPENRETAEGRTLTIAFAVAEPEDGPRGEPVVLMPGGPGMTVVPRGLRLLRRWGAGDRTLVVFDARGTGHSGPLMCTGLTLTESDIASMDLSLDEARTLERGAHLACRDELANRGIALAAYRSASIARDVRALREALGYDRWNLLGGSYGVRLGLTVLREDPDGVRSAVLLAGPAPDPEMLVTRDVPFFARALDLFFELCAADPACASRHPRLEQDFHDTYEALREEPWTVPVDPESFRRPAFTVNAQDFVRLVYWTLGSDSDLPELSELSRAFRDRDEAAAAAVLEDEYGGLSSTFSTGLMYAVDCNDAWTSRSRAEREAAAEGHPAALDDIRYFLAPCPDWPDPDPPDGERAPVESDVPALVVTAELDPMNPPATGEEHLRHLENGHHFVVPDASHGFAFNPRTVPCVAELIARFLDDPERRPDGSCLGELGPRRLVPEGGGR